MEWRIGCSGWSYKHWRGDFYPDRLPASRWFEHYARHFDTVELNASFYRLPAEKTVAGWAKNAPPAFTFAAKASRYLTHYRKLKEPEEPLNRFMGRMKPLGKCLGPILYQLPPNFPRNDDRLAAFLSLLPKGHVHAFEFRDHSWWTDDVFALLRRHHASFVIYHGGRTKTPLVATAADIYVRFHGLEDGYSGGYGRSRLRDWARDLGEIDGAKRAWVYFNNDVGGHAPVDAATLKELVR